MNIAVGVYCEMMCGMPFCDENETLVIIKG